MNVNFVVRNLPSAVLSSIAFLALYLHLVAQFPIFFVYEQVPLFLMGLITALFMQRLPFGLWLIVAIIPMSGVIFALMRYLPGEDVDALWFPTLFFFFVVFSCSLIYVSVRNYFDLTKRKRLLSRIGQIGYSLTKVENFDVLAWVLVYDGKTTLHDHENLALEYLDRLRRRTPSMGIAMPTAA